MRIYIVVFLIFVLSLCKKEELETFFPNTSTIYFPPNNNNEWKNISPTELGWNTSKLENLLTFLKDNNTRAFIVLKDGKIVIEKYFGKTILGNASFDKNSKWYWASAGKTLTATLVGIAQQEGFLNIHDSSSKHLGTGWTSLTPEKEKLIMVKHQLTMTTGLDYNTSNLNCTLPTCLTFKSEPGNEWFYHNASYTLLQKVVEQATKIDYNEYTYLKIESKIGMNGQWVLQGYNNIYWSTARDMARFGLLIANEGKWDNTSILTDKNYYNQMVNTSQNLNPSYGYLWWLNGKESIVLPGQTNTYNTSLLNNAPKELIAGLGKNGQFIDIIPNRNLVVIRMGEAPSGSLVPLTLHNQMWEKINLVIN